MVLNSVGLMKGDRNSRVKSEKMSSREKFRSRHEEGVNVGSSERRGGRGHYRGMLAA